MVNTYISDVFFNMTHGHHPEGSEREREVMTENAEMLISMLTELSADSWHIPTVDELIQDFFDRL